MLVASVMSETSPTELILAFGANHVRATSILLNIDSTVRTGFSNQNFLKVVCKVFV